MKSCYTFLFMLLLSVTAVAQTTIFDFEDGAPTFNDFNGSVTSVILNPDQTGINTTDSVAANVVPADAAFAGVNIPQAIVTTNGRTFTMQVWSPIADAPILLKVENSQADAAERQAIFTGTPGTWQELTFDFSTEANIDYASVTLFMNFNVVGSEELTFYWDNLVQSGDGTVGGDPELVTLDFEGDAPTFNDFNGAVTTVIANPDSQDPNTSANVAQNVIAGGSEFGGVNIPVAVDLSIGKAYSMQVWSPIADAPILLKLENTQEDAVERQVIASGPANSWQTLEFDFASEADRTFAGVTVFMNFNVVDAEERTFFWDNLVQSDNGGGGGSGDQIDLPITFDEEGVDYGLVGFEGADGEVVVDPTDASNMVGQFTKVPGAQIFAGVTMTSATGGPEGLVNPIPFSAGETTITVRTWSPTAGTPVRLKVEQSGVPEVSVETETMTTVAGAWETLEFDFSNQVDGTAAINLGSIYSKATIFFDFGSMPTEASTYFWDDVMFGGDGGGGGDDLEQIDLPVTFDDEDVDYGLAPFGGADAMIIVDPTDATNMVGEMTTGPGDEVWAGVTMTSTSGGPQGFVRAIAFTAEQTVMTVRTWSPTAGVNVLLKAENNADGAISVETSATTTVAGDWETLTFDFTNEADGTPALDFGAVYDKASIFFNFGSVPAAETTFYFDDVLFVGDPNGTNTPVLGLLEVFPNPTQDRLTITAPARMQDVTVYDLNGRIVRKQTVNADRVELDMTALAPGMYGALVNTAEGAMTVKLIKE